MKVLIVHNHYCLRGGEDSVFDTESRMLERVGLEVVRYERTNADIPAGIVGRLRTALGTVWSRRSYREVRAILRRERPDVMHCHNTFPLISPSVYYAAAAEGVPVVQTLHNYRLACLNGYLFRDGAICERCLGRGAWGGVRRRCYRGSLGGSLSVAVMLAVHRALGTWRRKVTRYIALTDFSKAKFVEAGLPEQMIAVKPNTLDKPDEGGMSDGTDGVGPATFLYLGRLSPEKGVDVLIDAWRILCDERGGGGQTGAGCGARLLIAGDGPEREALEAQAAGLPDVTFLGAVPKEKVSELLGKCSAIVLPSRCYETFGLVSVEAASVGIPTIAPDKGTTASLVADGKSGRLFCLGNPSSLASVLRDLIANRAQLRRMGAAAQDAYRTGPCWPERNLSLVMEIYREALETVRHA